MKCPAKRLFSRIGEKRFWITFFLVLIGSLAFLIGSEALILAVRHTGYFPVEHYGTGTFAGGDGLSVTTAIDIRTSGWSGGTDIGIDFTNATLNPSDYLFYDGTYGLTAGGSLTINNNNAAGLSRAPRFEPYDAAAHMILDIRNDAYDFLFRDFQIFSELSVFFQNFADSIQCVFGACG